MTQPMIPAAKPIIGEEEIEAVVAVMRSGMLAQGKQVAAFEEEFAKELSDGRICVATNSGTSSLMLGLLACGIGPGDEVLVPSFTFAATANSVAACGATPVFVDIEPDYFNMDPQDAAAKITERTKAIMPVHLYGHPYNVDAFKALCEKHNLMLFEDAAQAHGATWNGEYVGTFGSFAAFSFYPTKNMTSGEGGMTTCISEDVARMVRLYRNQGMEVQYANEVVGYNNRMTDIHAAIGREQLKKIKGWIETRQANAAFLTENISGVITPKVAPEATHVYHQYTIRVENDRDGFIEALRNEYQVGCGVYYPIPNHRLATFARPDELPQTEKAAKEVISLPVHPSLSEADLERIVSAVNAIAKAGA